MHNLRSSINKIERKHLGLILFVQSLVLLFFIVALVQKSTPPLTTRASESTFSQQVTDDAKICMELSPEDRPACAKIAGIKIAAHTQNPRERLAECLKFRPYNVHDCQLGLSGE